MNTNSDFDYNYANPQMTPQTPETPQFSMKWHKFLIYFALWAGAVIMILNAFLFFSGRIEGDPSTVRMVYSMFPAMKGVHMFMGLLCAGAVVIAISARFALAGYKANALGLLCLMYVCNAVMNPLYFVLCSIFAGIPLGELFDSSVIGQIVGPVAMIFINRDYYTKRAALFTR